MKSATDFLSPRAFLSPRGFLSPRFSVKSPEQVKREAEISSLKNWVAKQKHENYELLKQWDTKRAQFLAAHWQSLQQMKSSLERRIDGSFTFLKTVKEFLRQQITRLEDYCQDRPQDPTSALLNNGQIGRIHQSSSIFLRRVYHVNKNLNGSEHLLSQLKQIVSQFQNQLYQTEGTIQTTLETLNQYAIQLSELNATASEKCACLASNYQAQKDKNPFKCQTDTYTRQLSFLRSTKKQQQAQIKVAQLTVEMWKVAKKNQMMRAISLRKTLTSYQQKAKEAKLSNIKQEIFEQLNRNLEQHCIQQHYSFEQLIDMNNLQNVCEAMGWDTNDVEDGKFLKFLQTKKFAQMSCQKLVLREAQVQYQLDESNKMADTIMIITVDGFVHLIRSLQKRMYPQVKSDFMFKLDGNIKTTQISETEMVFTCRGGMGSTLVNMLKGRKTNTDQSFEFRVIFGQPQQKLSFCECISMIQSA